MMFDPTRDAGLARLVAYTPKMGRHYAGNRNYDRPGHDDVSRLSPYLRHRMVSEDEVLRACLAAHAPSTAEKFIQEVYWRTYWKGWLEHRPSVWTQYRTGLDQALNDVQTQSGLRRAWGDACAGATGIDCFDHWARELVETGYLHNHARMWFASIWIFTLRLPWELGADFFLRHLLDGDPASNTLGWRWVGGLQTVGKTYLARPDNIAKYTDGRFRPRDLAAFAAPLDGYPNPDRTALPTSSPLPKGNVGLLVTEDDLTPDWITDQISVDGVALYDGTAHRSPLHLGERLTSFMTGAFDDTAKRLGGATRLADVAAVKDWAAGFDAVVMSYPPVGGTADALASIETHKLIRPYDAKAWQYATAGFFKFKDKIPKLLRAYDNQLSLI
ncbi:FAD-binding domain-containing protein [Pseudooctadecabacter jejudonensis]|uniref:Deoxyribodipyrimidine photo-lyase n=1 Tax=Pseudooctadecabacter jejudonensis TaxID=1391910 RepID=A0A1Y5TBN7_9RHOB|nr:FAD-binding domain-containing protein [Pseudooctadecabacter jejudonensis]SLN60320.1 Deoxyribodipyrimidine photo-lyase [Pseudooctadecabacter jejudonensis]